MRAGEGGIIPFKTGGGCSSDKTVVLELVRLRSEEQFQPRSQNRILLQHRGFYLMVKCEIMSNSLHKVEQNIAIC